MNSESIKLVVERKTLNDLASSIKDGRINNNDKMLTMREKTGCKLLYIIEGDAYPLMGKLYCGIPYKCLQGKLDSLMFKHDISIIWTKSELHTAERLACIHKSFSIAQKANDTKNIKIGLVLPSPPSPPLLILSPNPAVIREITPRTTHLITPRTTHLITPPTAQITQEIVLQQLIKEIPKLSIDDTHVKILKQIPGISFQTATLMLANYNIIDILVGKVCVDQLYNLVYISGYKIGDRSKKIFNSIAKLSLKSDDAKKTQCAILSCVRGITVKTASLILDRISFIDIITTKFNSGDITNIAKSEKRKIGNAVETSIKRVFREFYK
jgi:ERCC4-type nuclease